MLVHHQLPRPCHFVWFLPSKLQTTFSSFCIPKINFVLSTDQCQAGCHILSLGSECLYTYSAWHLKTCHDQAQHFHLQEAIWTSVYMGTRPHHSWLKSWPDWGRFLPIKLCTQVIFVLNATQNWWRGRTKTAGQKSLKGAKMCCWGELQSNYQCMYHKTSHAIQSYGNITVLVINPCGIWVTCTEQYVHKENIKEGSL